LTALARWTGSERRGGQFWRGFRRLGQHFGSLDQLAQAGAKAVGEALDIAPARVSLAVLDLADPGLSETIGRGKLHLTEAALIADGPSGTAQGGLIELGWHGSGVGFALWRMKSLDELRGIEVESSGQLEQVVQAEVALAALDLADKCPVQASAISERFLAQTELAAVGLDPLTKGSSGV
jgi:hypothetical protein